MVFLLIQKNLTKIGISRQQSQQASAFNGKTLLGTVVLGINAILQFIFLVHDAQGFREFTESIYMTSIGLVTFICFVSLALKTDEVYGFIDVADETVEETKKLDYPIADGIKESIIQVEKWSAIVYFVMVKITTVCGMSPKIIVSLYFFYAKDMGRDSFQLPVPMWLPYDWRNPSNYLITVAVHCLVIVLIFNLIASIASLGIGCYVFAMTATTEFKSSIHLIEDSAIRKREHLQALKRFNEFIEWHSILKQLVNKFSNLFRQIFLAAFIWSTITICGAMLMVQMEITHHEMNLLVQLVLLFEAFYSFGLIFVVCELCQRATDEFGDVNVVIGQFKWYKFPWQIKQRLPTIIQFAQQDIVFKCFGSISCSREAFKKVVNSAFSYFMVIRRFYD